MRTKKGYTLRPLGTEYILVAEGLEVADASCMISMNSTAAFLWMEVEGKEFDVQTLVDLLVDNWDVSRETAAKDVDVLLKSWKKAEVVEELGAAKGSERRHTPDAQQHTGIGLRRKAIPPSGENHIQSTP